MRWAIILLSFCAVAKEDASAATKKAERLAQRKMEEERDGDILGVPQSGAEVAHSEQQLDLFFKKVWSSHTKWAGPVLVEATNYARYHEPRLLDSEDDQRAEISRIFFNTLWEPLQGRGWKAEGTDANKIFQYADQKVSRGSALPRRITFARDCSGLTFLFSLTPLVLS